MTRETRERIKAYKKLLPDMRERVFGVAVLLAVSVTMMVTASFAWITLSRAPEVTGMQTTVAANGNLEIALASGDTYKPNENGEYMLAPAEKPVESQIGDSSATKGIVGANTTWGNLVNVSDPIYGISQIALRPALLSEYNLNTNPLYGATYGEDGRVIATADKYQYTSWKDFNGTYSFGAGKDVRYGVRAISSVTLKNLTGNKTAEQFEAAVTAAYDKMLNGYIGIVSDDPNVATNVSEKPGEFKSSITALEGLVTVFAHVRIKEMGMEHKDKPSTSCTPHIYYFYKMLLLFREVLDAEGEALLAMANWQAWSNSADGKTNTFKDIADLKSKVNSLSSYGVELTTLAGYISDYNNVQWVIDNLKEKALACQDPDDPSNPEVTWAEIQPAVSKLLNVSTTEIDGTELGKLDTSAGIDLFFSSGTKNILIKEGVLKNFEQRVLAAKDRMRANVTITVYAKKVINLDKTVNGVVKTNAAGEPSKTVDQVKSASGAIGGTASDATAKDTYGLALDLWVRTNYPQAILTLEGSAIYEDREVNGTDSNGNPVELYVMTTEETTNDVYQKENVWYYASNHGPVPTEAQEGATFTRKTEQVIVGYQGENRVWEDWESLLELGYIEKDATTQGAGSCYVFYASPTEQPKLLEMLQAFSIAFIDQDGNTLGTAILNTDKHYENQGKVTVPVELISGTTFKDAEGKEHIGITTLRQNEPTRITAIVYLNGRALQNENVLAAGSIQGQLNIQFGTNATLIAPDNEELMSQYRTITAKVAVGSKESTDKAAPIQLDYSSAGHTATVTLTVEGEQPERIEGFFVRMINDVQGTKGETKSFRINADGTWTAEFKITAPGNYVLNSLLVDGVQYSLHDGSTEGYAANHPAILIDGMELTSVSTDVSNGTYLRDEQSFPVVVTAGVASEITPDSVTAVFINEDESQQYSAVMKYDSGNGVWVGTADIRKSGTYTLRYVSVTGKVDGQSATYTMDVPAGQQTKLVLYLGLRAAVYSTATEAQRKFEVQYENGTIKTQTVPLQVRVWDGSGELMKNLTDVTVYYHTNTSAMDQDGTSAVLTWTEANGGYYVADMGIDNLGVFSVDRLAVSMMGQSSALYNLNDNAPVFTCYSPLPPEYVSSETVPYQLAISQSAWYKVTLENATTATVTGTFVRTDGAGTVAAISDANTQTARGVEAEGGVFNFALTGDGVWKLTTVHVTTPAGQYDLAAVDAEGDAAPETKVITSVNTKTSYYNEEKNAYEENAFSSAVELNGAFLQTHNVKIKVEATDYNGDPIQGLTGATWMFTHSATKEKQLEYGGYLGSNGEPVLQDGGRWPAEGGLSVDADNATITDSQALRLAGDYTSVITLEFKDAKKGVHTYELTSGNPKFAVKSVTPTVKITATSPSGSQSAYNGRTRSGRLSQYCTIHTVSYNAGVVEGKTANVCYTGVLEDYDVWVTRYQYVTLTQPSVTIELDNSGFASSATLSFGESAKIHKEAGKGTVSQFSWSSEGECKRYIGDWSSNWGSDDDRTVAGTITATELVLKDSSNNEYKVATNITINNPY